jgi:ABC-type nitrate/sulfonate/bicarbonate transport system permease component
MSEVGTKRTQERFRSLLAPAAGIAVLVGIWVWAGNAGVANGMVVTPVEAIRPIVGDSYDTYLRAATATISAAARGFLIGGTLAFLAALVAVSVPPLRGVVVRFATVANAAPWVAVAPCMLIVLGRDQGPVAVAALAVFFPIFVSTSVGLTSAPQAIHDVASALGAGRLRRVWSVQLPASWPSTADGFKLAAPAALAGAVFGEWYGADRGLGVLLITAMQGARPDRLWAAALLCALAGLVAYGCFSAVRATARWRYGSSIAQQTARVERSPGGRGRHIAGEVVAFLIVVGVLVGVWWLWVEAADISPIVVPPPPAVVDDVTSSWGEYGSAALHTTITAAIALVIGVTLGLAAALAASRFRFAAGMAVPVMVLLSATPLFALFPLFARLIGYNERTVWALAALLVFYPMFVFTRSGLAAASAPMLDVVDAMGGDRSKRFRLVVLPAACPHMATGFRIAVGSAVIAAVVGESLVGRQGLGVEFAYSYRLLELPRAFGAAIVVIALSLAAFSLAGAAERSVHARWT